jgi:hypothetical protein
VEISHEHQRLLRHFLEIEKGKRLSVGPATVIKKPLVSPVEEMHSLNIGSKVKEYA